MNNILVICFILISNKKNKEEDYIPTVKVRIRKRTKTLRELIIFSTIRFFYIIMIDEYGYNNSRVFIGLQAIV